MLSRILPVSLLVITSFSVILTHSSPTRPLSDDQRREKWGYNWAYSGIPTFGHLQNVRCLTRPEERFDIAIVGAPFDTGTTYRPGARFGPRAIRAASSRHLSSRGFNTAIGFNPYSSWAHVIDCDDIPIIPFDNNAGLQQMTEAFADLLNREPSSTQITHPRLVVLGGDHLVALPVLRALRSLYGSPVTLLHFDSHIDTLGPDVYPSARLFPESMFNHGTVFWHAAKEGLLDTVGSVHAGVNTRLSGNSWTDYETDAQAGFVRIPASDVDDLGTRGVIEAIRKAIPADAKVYLSIDIDVLDPAFAPGTGAPEPGGWSTRELLTILRGVCGDLDIIGADVVEVAPAYDTPGGDTAFAAAGIVYEVISSMVLRGYVGTMSDKQDDPANKATARSRRPPPVSQALRGEL